MAFKPIARIFAAVTAGTLLAVGLPGNGRGSFDGPPAEGRPADFSGAVGTFRVRTEVDRTELAVGQACQLTLWVEATGAAASPPHKPALAGRAGFKGRFLVEDLPDGPQDSRGPWKFRYRLKPVGVGPTEVPAVRFDYFTRGMVPPARGYRATYSPAIPLWVQAGLSPGAAEMGHALADLPTTALELEEEPAVVLGRPWSRWESAAFVAGWLLGVPLVVVACGLAVRLAGNARPSREARSALKALQRLPAGDPDAEGPARVVVGYLRRRLSCRAAEPTPDEVAECVYSTGLPEAAERTVVDFMSEYDAWRFGPVRGAGVGEWRSRAAAVIRALERRQ